MFQLPNLPLFTLKVVLLLPCIGLLYITLMYRCLVYSAPSRQIFPKEGSALTMFLQRHLMAFGSRSQEQKGPLASSKRVEGGIVPGVEFAAGRAFYLAAFLPWCYFYYSTQVIWVF